MKHYKFQALVTLHPADGGGPSLTLDTAPRHMVLLGRNDESGRSQFFSALVNCDDDRMFPLGNPRLQVTLRVTGDDVPDYLAIGSHFNLWLGGDVGEGIVTRRLFV